MPTSCTVRPLFGSGFKLLEEPQTTRNLNMPAQVGSGNPSPSRGDHGVARHPETPSSWVYATGQDSRPLAQRRQEVEA